MWFSLRSRGRTILRLAYSPPVFFFPSACRPDMPLPTVLKLPQLSLEHLFRGFAVWGNSGIVSKYVLVNWFSKKLMKRQEAWVLRLQVPLSFMVLEKFMRKFMVHEVLRLQWTHQFCPSFGIWASHTTPSSLAVSFGHVFNFFQLQTSRWLFKKYCRSESTLSFYHLILHYPRVGNVQHYQIVTLPSGFPSNMH